MTVVTLGIDALDPELVDSKRHPNLTLDEHKKIETIIGSKGEPSTHELWPTIITGYPPEEHGLVLDDGVAWESSLLKIGSSVSDYLLPSGIQTRIGAWILNNTEEDAFRVPASYYAENGIETVFDGHQSKAIGVPNYVTDPDGEDREHNLRKRMGKLFERDPEAKGGHQSDDPTDFYEMCMEMSMVRIARVRRGLRSKNYELVFGYTSGLDLIGHVSYDLPALQKRAYDELNDFVGELRDDLNENDELLIISDHGLQDGVHTHKAMIAATEGIDIASVSGVEDVRAVTEEELSQNDHLPEKDESTPDRDEKEYAEVKSQLEDLGYV